MDSEKITEKIAALPQDAHFFSLEFFPPKTTMGSSNLQARLERMAQALRPLFVTVTWGAGGSTASKSLELAEICQRQLGLTTCLHLTCTNMNKSLIDEALEDAKVLGIRNILALRGDPPRNEEYQNGEVEEKQEDGPEFTYAVDLVRYIRQMHGDYFCVGVAGYPEGHSDESHPEHQDPLHDLPYLIEKTKAGADFIMTQLFYDVDAYRKYEKLLRDDPSGVFKSIPIIPGLMPIQSYQILKRTTKLSHAKLPPDIEQRLLYVKADDEAVKKVGVDIVSNIVEEIKGVPNPGPRGFHFYTLNLEKAVAFILERCDLIPPSTPVIKAPDEIAVEEIAGLSLTNGSKDVNGGHLSAGRSDHRSRRSSVASDPYNQVVVERGSSSGNSNYLAPADEAGIPRDKINSRANTLAISEGEGSLGREATWDDFPNGRWGDARSPAYGEIDGYGVSLHVSITQAIKLWGYPVTVEDISKIFERHICGEIGALPFSEEGLTEETNTIKTELLQLIRKGWWTVASQPAVNGVSSDHPTFGWGPKNGYVFQKAFVELFLPSADWEKLRKKLDRLDQVSYYAGNAAGDFVSSDRDSVNAVTWGTFPGKEIITPTIIEEVSFRAWLEEAFSIWGEWQRVYKTGTASAKLISGIRQDYWLVNIIHHAYVEQEALWDLLLTE